jgi:hypothetical protein
MGTLRSCSRPARPGKRCPADHWTPRADSRSRIDHRGRRLLVPASRDRRSAILFDYDGQRFKNITTPPTKVVAIHGLLNF